MELGNLMQLDGDQLWQEYRSFVNSLPEPSIMSAVKTMHSCNNVETKKTAFPTLSDLLARVATIPFRYSEVFVKV